MKQKIPLSDSEWSVQLEKAVDLIQSGQTFLFSGDIDKDSLGSMISLALYLKQLQKNVYVIIPIAPAEHLDYLEQIIVYNSIPILKISADLQAVSNEIDSVIFCDTANAKLVPYYSQIANIIEKKQLPVLEIDHHFGTDSEELIADEVKLFRQCNAATELTAELLIRLHEKVSGAPHPFHQRNIVIGLLTGLFGDTVGGSVIPYRQSYDHWIELLDKYLENDEDRRPSSEGSDPGRQYLKFRSSAEILKHLNRLTEEQERCLEELRKRIKKTSGLGFINLLDSIYPEIQAVCQPLDSPWFADFLAILLNIIPEESGKVGVVCFHGKNADKEDCIFIKIRRAAQFQNIDLRTIEEANRKKFGNFYMGGGGHPGAVSFRVHAHAENDFLCVLHEIMALLELKINDLNLESLSNHPASPTL
jgi:nanoRNase/pAp phosphatase (c-di-AMP/oligoRNAs hydrolase)